MRLYIDDDSIARVLVRMLRTSGYDVEVPADAGLSGAEDPIHLTHAVRQQRVCPTGNHHDFRILHELILEAAGHHPGILVIRKDNDPKRDLSPRGVVQALGNLAASGMALTNQLQILNHWS